MSLIAEDAASGPGAAGRALPWRAALAATAGSVMFGFVPLATRGLYAEGLGPFSLLSLRYLIGLAAMLAAARAARLDFRGAARRGAWRIALVGATLGSAQTLCFFKSLETLQTSISVLLFYTYPAMTLALERVVFKRRVRPAAVLCVALILGGAALIAAPGLHAGDIDPRGFLWAVPGPVIYALYLASNAKLMARHPPLIGAGFLYMGFAATYLGIVAVAGLELPATAAGWLSILFLALGTGAVSMTLFSYSAPRLGPSSYAIIANCELVTVVLVGTLVLGEPLTADRAAGGALVVAGILLHGLTRRPASARSR